MSKIMNVLPVIGIGVFAITVIVVAARKSYAVTDDEDKIYWATLFVACIAFVIFACCVRVWRGPTRYYSNKVRLTKERDDDG